jgi:hypothetical protein
VIRPRERRSTAPPVDAAGFAIRFVCFLGFVCGDLTPGMRGFGDLLLLQVVKGEGEEDGARVREALQPALRQEGDADPHGGARRRR